MATVGKILRRTFLFGSAAIAGGVAFGYYKYHQDPENPLKPAEGNVALNPWLIINQDGVTVITPRAEMGQGVHTTLKALVAEELDYPWEMIKTEHGPASKAYGNDALLQGGVPFAEYDRSPTAEFARDAMGVLGHFLGLQVTGGSTSMADGFEKMRQAGAGARQVLIKAAAQRADQSEVFMRTEDGFVIARDGTKWSYQELAQDASQIEPPSNPELKPKSEWKLLGKTMPRVDMVAKVTGQARFGMDFQIEGMKFASVRCNPHLGGTMEGFDASNAKAMPGVEEVIDIGDGVAVIAANTWAAIQAAKAIEVNWNKGHYPDRSAEIYNELLKAFDAEPNSTLRNEGDIGHQPADGDTVIEAEYQVPYLAHSTMEPMNATALFDNGQLDIWTGTQAPLAAQEKAAEIASVDVENVRVHTLFLGGGFGRRTEFDCVLQAVKLAVAKPGTPIKLIWSREEDMTHDFYRPVAVARMKGIASPKGPKLFKADIAAPSVSQAFGERFMGFAAPGPDKALVEGCHDQPYAIPNYQVNGYISDLSIPVGFWRSVGNSYNGFFHESFMDELAFASNLDPVQMRLDLMQPVHAPSARVVQAVAEMSDWGSPLPEGAGRGVAFTYSFGSPTAQVIEVRQTDKGIKLHKVWCATDVGTALDPGNIRAQMMSGIIYGLSAAIMGEISFADGKVEQSNFHDYDALRMFQTPQIEVQILENNPHIGGVGEPGTPPSMPALANAIFNLTGQRIRSLPLNKSVDFV